MLEFAALVSIAMPLGTPMETSGKTLRGLLKSVYPPETLSAVSDKVRAHTLFCHVYGCMDMRACDARSCSGEARLGALLGLCACVLAYSSFYCSTSDRVFHRGQPGDRWPPPALCGWSCWSVRKSPLRNMTMRTFPTHTPSSARSCARY